MSFLRGIGRLAVRLGRAGLRAAPLRMWILFGAGPVLCLYAAALVGIIADGGWLPEHQSQQLSIIGWTLAGVGALIAIVLVTIAKVKVGASGPGGTRLEIDGRDDEKLVAADRSNSNLGGGYGYPSYTGGYGAPSGANYDMPPHHPGVEP